MIGRYSASKEARQSKALLEMAVEHFRKPGIARLARALLFCYVALVACPIRYWPMEPDGENTWVFALNYAAAHGLAMGRDIVWNTGPLGYLVFPQDIGENLPRALVVQTLLWVGVIAVLANVFFRERLSLRNLALFSAFFALSAPLFWFNRVGVENLLLAAALILLVVNRRRGGMKGYVAALVLLGITPLIKPTATMIGAGALSGYLVDRVIELRRQVWRHLALAALVPMLVAGSVCWLMLPSFSAFRAYLRGTAEFAGEYSVAVSLSGSRLELLVTVEAVLLLACLVAFRALHSRRDALFLVLLLAAPIFISAKHGLVRHDVHFVNFLCFATLAMALVCLHLDGFARRQMPGLLVLLSTFVLWQDYVPKHLGGMAAFSEASGIRAGRRVWGALSGLSALRESLRMQSASAFSPSQRLEPEIRAIIGDAPVTSFSYVHSDAALDGLNLQIYPVLQSDAAFTPYLDSLNADWISGQGPRFLTFDGFAVDGRQFWAETPRTWFEVYRWYDTRFQGSRNLLLERRAQPRFARVERVASFPLSSTHRIDLPVSSGPVFWSLPCGMTRVGKLRKLLLKIPEVKIELAGHSRAKGSARVIIGVLSTPVLGNYLPSTLEELADLLRNDVPSYSIGALTFYGDGFRYYSACRVEIFRTAP
jgi:hypothetical protein